MPPDGGNSDSRNKNGIYKNRDAPYWPWRPSQRGCDTYICIVVEPHIQYSDPRRRQSWGAACVASLDSPRRHACFARRCRPQTYRSLWISPDSGLESRTSRRVHVSFVCRDFCYKRQRQGKNTIMALLWTTKRPDRWIGAWLLTLCIVGGSLLAACGGGGGGGMAASNGPNPSNDGSVPEEQSPEVPPLPVS